jgi:putative CocE/NonD family hydrolase
VTVIAGGRVTVQADVAATMRDGTSLRADVYRPAGDGPWPALVCRTPYGKRGEAFGADYPGIAHGLAGRGYMVVVQDVRGRYASDGEYRWLYGPEAAAIHAADGFDTTEWAAGLDGCDGRVGTFGNSYDAYTAMRTAGAAPPSLAAALASGVASRLQDESRGIFEPIYLEWLNGMAADMRARAGDDRGPTDRSAAEREWELTRDKWLWALPYGDIPARAFGPAAQHLATFLREQEIDRWQLPDSHHAVQVPVCHVTGWWDFVVRGTIANFQSLVASSPAHGHRLVIGPWSHEPGALAPGTGAVSYGPVERAEYHDLIADWYDLALHGDDPGELADAPVRAFVLNENRWRSFSAWPPPASAPRELYLNGERLSDDAGGTATRGFDYDPRDPVMSMSDWSTRAVDQAPLDHRRDVLRYLSDPLDGDLLLAGDVACVLWAASDGPETDFTAKLVEVRRDGLAVALCQGILRTRFMHGYDTVARLEPGRPYELAIELGPVGVLLRAGSRLRLDVSSSDFPNFDRNHNTGRDFWSDPTLRTARQTIFTDREHPSRLIVPVLDPGREQT